MVWSEPLVDGDSLPSPRASMSMLAVPVDGGMAAHSFTADDSCTVRRLVSSTNGFRIWIVNLFRRLSVCNAAVIVVGCGRG